MSAVADIGIVVLTVLSVTVLVGLHYGWPVVGGDLDYDHKLFIGGPALFVLVTAGLLWTILRLWPSLRGVRDWTWSVAAAPAIVIVALVVGVMFPRGGFDEARPELEQIAQEVLADPESVRNGVQFGSVDISRVEERGGAVYFFDSDNSFGTTYGWIYSPDGPPSWVSAQVEHIDGPWYEFERSS